MSTLDKLCAIAREHRNTGAIAAFDWDDTCIGGDLGVAVLGAADRRDGGDRLPRYLVLDEEQGHMVSYPFNTTVFAGLTREELVSLGERAFDEGVARGELVERPWVPLLMKELRANGWEIWVITASPGACVEPIAARYGVPRERVIGMELTVREDGRFTDTLVEPSPCGPGKPGALLAATGVAATMVLSDSPADLPLLSTARYPVAVGRSPALTAHAQAHGWLHIEEP